MIEAGVQAFLEWGVVVCASVGRSNWSNGLPSTKRQEALRAIFAAPIYRRNASLFGRAFTLPGSAARCLHLGELCGKIGISP